MIIKYCQDQLRSKLEARRRTVDLAETETTVAKGEQINKPGYSCVCISGLKLDFLSMPFLFKNRFPKKAI